MSYYREDRIPGMTSMDYKSYSSSSLLHIHQNILLQNEIQTQLNNQTGIKYKTLFIYS